MDLQADLPFGFTMHPVKLNVLHLFMYSIHQHCCHPLNPFSSTFHLNRINVLYLLILPKYSNCPVLMFFIIFFSISVVLSHDHTYKIRNLTLKAALKTAYHLNEQKNNSSLIFHYQQLTFLNHTFTSSSTVSIFCCRCRLVVLFFSGFSGSTFVSFLTGTTTSSGSGSFVDPGSIKPKINS